MKEKKRVLVIRFSSIGDIVLTSTVVRCLALQRPDLEIHYLTKWEYKELLSENPHIHQLHLYQGNLKECLGSLKPLGFSYIIDLHNNLRSLLVRAYLRRSGDRLKKHYFKRWLLTSFGINRLPQNHIVDRYMKTVAFLGVQNDHLGLDFFISPEVDKSMTSKLPDHYIAFAIGAAHFTKKLPPEKIVEICRSTTGQIILLGGPNDIQQGKYVETNCTNVTNYCGQLSLMESAHVIQKSDGLITHDTGMMHIGAALKQKIISVWGSTSPVLGFYPYLPQAPENYAIVEVDGLKCRPCTKMGREKCPKGHLNCLNLITAKQVSMQLKKLEII